MPVIRSPLMRVLFAAAALLLVVRTGDAQQLDSVRAGVTRPSVIAAPDSVVRERTLPADTLRPPISPGRAFLLSFLVPGAGQAKLDRGYAGGMFFLIEVTALALAHRSAEDLRIARRFAGDSIPLRYQVNATTGLPTRDGNGDPVVAAWSVPRYDAAYVRTRRLHYEDWLAVMAFNHLFAGADALVAAHLWDLPGRVGLRQTPFGPLLQASFAFR